MSIRMSESDKNTILNTYKPNNESYKAMMWGVIMASSKDLVNATMIGTASSLVLGAALGGGVAGAFGALSNQSCYIGLTESQIIFCTLGSFNVSEIKSVFSIPLNQIKKIKKKFSIIPGRTILMLYISKNNTLKLSLMNNSIGSDIKNQKENVQCFLNTLLGNQK